MRRPVAVMRRLQMLDVVDGNDGRTVNITTPSQPLQAKAYRAALAAAGVDAVILLLIGGGLAGAGASRLRTLDPKPHRTIAALQQNIEWLKGQLRP